VDIRIDHTSIEFTLEQEHTVGEVVSELRPFIESHARTISALTVDDEQLSINDPETWENRAIEAVQHMQIETVGPFDRQISDLGALVEYFTIFGRTLQERRPQQIDGVLQELPHVRAGIGPLLGENERPRGGVLAELDHVLGEYGQADSVTGEQLAAAPSDRVNALSDAINRIILILQARRRELALPLQELERTARVLHDYTDHIVEVPVLLQTGKDRDAMERIAGFSELASRLLRLCSLVMTNRVALPLDWKPEALERGAERLNGILRELVGAFDAGDTVLIGDLVEYEIVPGLQDLLQHIPAGDRQS